MVNLAAKGSQIWEILPILEPLAVGGAKEFDKGPTQALMINHPWFPLAVVAAYLALVFYGPAIMKQQKEFNLELLLALWNLGLSIFSAWGSLLTMPHLIHFLTIKSFEETVCDSPAIIWGYGATGMAVQFFVLSKIPEVLDTVFIVLRKKPLTFLHWYHHVSVLLFCWNSYVTESAAGLYFVAMNYTVHAVMYFYYFARSIHIVPAKFPSWTITILQISQFIVGTYVVCAGIYFYVYGGAKYAPGTCHNKFSNMAAGAIMYASYLYLFIDFAFRRFIFPQKKTDKVSQNGKNGNNGHSNKHD